MNIEIGSIVQSAYTSRSGKQGNMGVVLKIHDVVGPRLIQVFYPKSQTWTWAQAKDMKVVA